MKNYQMIIFFTIALIIYTLPNTYIYLKGYGAIPSFRNYRIAYFTVFILLATSFIAGKIIEVKYSSLLSDILNIIGGFWMAFLLYGFLFLILSDIISLVLRISGVLDHEQITAYKKWAFIITLSGSFILIAGGFVNALIPKVKQYDITIDKPAGERKKMKIAAVSDIHLGSIIRKRSMLKLSSVLDTLRPDMILLLGDIVDGEIGPVLRGDLLRYLSYPPTTHGLWAITGNHEFIGGAHQTIPYIEGKGIRILKDELIEIGDGIQLIGRIDRDGRRFFGNERKTLSELAAMADKSRPVILLDHQPFNLGDTEKNGIDLQLSGHTHNGQMWPLNYVTRMIYELSYGYLKKGNSHVIVSSGFGLWGPRVRSGSRSEILVINVSFNGTPGSAATGSD